jgi:hypothetical protein
MDAARTSLFGESGERESLTGGNLTPGTKSIGYRCVEAPKDAKTVEFHFEINYTPSAAIFAFDIPPVEE